MATNSPSEINGSDPTVLRQLERQNTALQTRGVSAPPSVSGTSGANTTTTAGAVRNLAPIVSGSETLYPQSTTATSSSAVTINSSINNDTGDVTTVYTTNGRITVNPINQTINQYTSVDSGVSQIVAGNGVTISSTGASGTGVVTVSSSTAFGNIVNVNLNGNASSVLRGDGTWGADANSSYGNSNVSSLLASFGSNTISTTGNVSVGNISATNLGNIVGTNYDGNAANVLHGDGTWSADVTNYGNSNVASYLPTYTGNISSGNAALGNLITANYANIAFDVNANVVDANYLYGDGSNITNLPVGNIASINLDGNSQTWLAGNGVFANIAIPSVGNIATINLDGNNSNILYGNGVFAAAPSGGGLPLANGNSNFDIAALDGNATITANGTSTWTFGTDGLLTFPGTPRIDTGANNFEVQAAEAINFEANTVVNIYTDGSNNAYQWQFDDSGKLNLAGGGSIIESLANSSLDPTLPNVSTMTLTPDANYNSQVLVLDPTAPGHIHLRAFAFSNIDEPAANIFLGGEDTAFEITQGANNQAVIHSNGKSWTFGNDGNISSDTLTFTTTFANVKTVEYQTAGVWDLYVEDSVTGSNTAISRLNVSFKDNLIDKPQVYIENTKESDGIALRWTFDENGNLNFPRDAVGNTDPYLVINGGSGPAINSVDASLAGPANLLISSDYLNLTGFTGAKVAIKADNGEIATDANMVLTTNAANVGNAFSWTFATDGTLTLPGNLVASGASPAPSLSGFSSLSAADSMTVGSNAVMLSSSGNITVTDTVSADIFRTSDGGLTHSGTGLGINADAGKDVYLSADFGNVNWNFGANGNLTLPGNTVAINFANGSSAFGNIVATNLDSNVSNVLLGNGSFGPPPALANAVVWTSVPVSNTATGTPGQIAYDSGGNLYFCYTANNWAKGQFLTSW